MGLVRRAGHRRLSGEGSMIVIDYLDGRVYEVVDIVH